MSDEMPKQPTTVALEAPPKWAIELSQRVADGFANVNERLDTVEQNVSILVDDKKTVNERLSRIEAWKENEVTARLNANSDRVKGESQVNLKQDAAIAAVLEKLDAVDKKTDVQTAMLSKAGAVFKDPRVIAVLVVLYTILKGWAEKKGYL